jgi:hypothetical protein
MLRLYVYPRNNKPHGKVNDMPNANSLIKYSHPLYVLGMSKAVRDQTGKARAILSKSLFGKMKWKESSRCLLSLKT